MLALLWIVAALVALPATGAAPVIDLWYGAHQQFGRLGAPPRWINVLGTVRDPSRIEVLEYRLNGAGWHRLSIGPDERRLAGPGDFNVEIETEALRTGANVVEVRATDTAGAATVIPVKIDLHRGATPQLPYTIEWPGVADIQTVAQVIDGRWRIDRNGIRTEKLGYDRLIAVGDSTWRNYEVDVSFVVHAIDPTGYRAPSNGPIVGAVLNWPGHTDWGGASRASAGGRSARSRYTVGCACSSVIGGCGWTTIRAAFYAMKVWAMAEPERSAVVPR